LAEITQQKSRRFISTRLWCFCISHACGVEKQKTCINRIFSQKCLCIQWFTNGHS